MIATSNDDKKQLIATYLKHDPLLSNRHIARMVETNHKLVGRVRQELEATGHIEPAAWRKDPRSGNLTQSAHPGPARRRPDIPDVLWPSDNDWGIPTLDPNLQADLVDLPVMCWGQRGRSRRIDGGTYHFYTDDYRFNALWQNPGPVVNSGCISIVEPNFSCHDQTPTAVALHQIYKKRWLARYWQSQGIRVLVDLNVARPFYQLNLLGVPAGWQAYATRATSDRPEDALDEYRLACAHRGGRDVLFLVIGGGRQAQAMCREYGWLFVAGGRNG